MVAEQQTDNHEELAGGGKPKRFGERQRHRRVVPRVRTEYYTRLLRGPFGGDHVSGLRRLPAAAGARFFARSRGARSLVSGALHGGRVDRRVRRTAGQGDRQALVSLRARKEVPARAERLHLPASAEEREERGPRALPASFGLAPPVARATSQYH